MHRAVGAAVAEPAADAVNSFPKTRTLLPHLPADAAVRWKFRSWRAADAAVGEAADSVAAAPCRVHSSNPARIWFV
jgi:hypothetical protein